MAENKPNAAVICSNCGDEIRFFKEPGLPEGFSLACPSCARRNNYALTDVFIPKGSGRKS
jgi:hypothetical protein